MSRYLPLIIVSFLLSSVAAAQGFSTTNAQFLYGWGFDDSVYGNDTRSGEMATITLEHFSDFSYGTAYFFTDLSSGHFEDGTSYHSYTEATLHGRVLRTFNGTSGHGLIRDIFASASIERANGYGTWLVGGGLEFGFPGFSNFSVELLRRDNRFEGVTPQVTAVFGLPVPIGRQQFSIGGFVDIHGTRKYTDYHTQIQGLWNPPHTRLDLGVELLYHKIGNYSLLVPQPMARWRF